MAPMIKNTAIPFVKAWGAFVQHIIDLKSKGIDYIGEVLERIRPAKGFVPILTLITDYQPLSKERIKTLIDFLGMPYSYTDSGDFNPHLHPQ